MSFFEKIIIVLLILILVVVNIIIFTFVFKIESINGSKGYIDEENSKSNVNNVVMDIFDGEYEVYQNDRLIKTFFDYNTAIDYAKNYENAAVKRLGGSWLWDNTPIYNVYKTGSDEFKAFSSFREALDYANSIGSADIFYRNSKTFIWNNYEQRKGYYMIQDVKQIAQNPELNRGCEVTSLTMLLNYKGINVDKLTLAQNIQKDTTPYRKEGNTIYYGNPNVGFVGDIYSINNRGLGVFHQPIYELLTTYIGGEALDITGCSSSDVLFYVGKNRPVWVIVNAKFKPLPSSEFETWRTAEGEVYITYSEHSVLITGYDKDFVYFNDPLNPNGIQKQSRDSFFKAWEQMGRQAVTYCP